MSTQVRAPERELGEPLFVHAGRGGLRLAAAGGERSLPHGRPALGLVVVLLAEPGRRSRMSSCRRRPGPFSPAARALLRAVGSTG